MKPGRKGMSGANFPTSVVHVWEVEIRPDSAVASMRYVSNGKNCTFKNQKVLQLSKSFKLKLNVVCIDLLGVVHSRFPFT